MDAMFPNEEKLTLGEAFGRIIEILSQDRGTQIVAYSYKQSRDSVIQDTREYLASINKEIDNPRLIRIQASSANVHGQLITRLENLLNPHLQGRLKKLCVNGGGVAWIVIGRLTDVLNAKRPQEDDRNDNSPKRIRLSSSPVGSPSSSTDVLHGVDGANGQHNAGNDGAHSAGNVGGLTDGAPNS